MVPVEALRPKAEVALDDRSKYLRRLVMKALLAGGRGHTGPALSIVEILRVLYDDVMNIRPREPAWPQRDRCILSKGHGCLALYAVLADKGYFPQQVLESFGRADSILGGHPEYGKVPGVEASTGSLGHGLSIGVGMALAGRLKKSSHRVFVILGDGELDEGSVWEAAMCASKHKLENLVAIVDYNKFQSYGPKSQVLDLEPLAEKWRSFGFSVAECDGHDVGELRHAFSGVPLSSGRPTVIICHTVKGKGVPSAENNAEWHHKNSFDDQDKAIIKAALGE